MSIHSHLILQTVTLRPSGEWTPPGVGWAVVRIGEGVGYWRQGDTGRELNAGDGFIASNGTKPVIRASQLGPLKLEYFLVQPQLLNGLLTVAESNQLEHAADKAAGRIVFFKATEALGQKFSRLVHQAHPESLPGRSSLVQLWAQAVSGLLVSTAFTPDGLRLRERFRQLVAQMPDSELMTRSITELAERLHCSERHFSRLFREELGVPLRTRRTELRLQHASQMLAETDEKIIRVAYDSGYRHLGLFNVMFKKRFGVTPSQWRQQNAPKSLAGQPKNYFKRSRTALALLFLLQIVLAGTGAAQTTNAAPKLTVEKYLVSGNTVLTPDAIGAALTNAPGAFGTNVTFTEIRAALGDLQMAYRERGFVTVSVSLPPQKLTNATVRVKVTEGRLADVAVKGNRYYGTENVLAALPSLHTNMLLNSHVFQRELDLANANRDRQIYPVIGPGPEPGTSELTLKVKDRFPLHGRVEINNQATPGTPDSRVAFSAQYAPDWNREHQVGVQYTFTPVDFHGRGDYYFSPLDLPQIANYSAYYRLPLGGPVSLQRQIDESQGRFGYDEVTHRFNLPPATGRPEFTLYASRSISDTGVQRGPRGYAAFESATNLSGHVYYPLSISTNSAGQSVTLNESVGVKFSMPLPQLGRISSIVSVGADFKRYRQTDYNTNENFFETQYYQQNGQLVVNDASAPQPFPVSHAEVDYFPLNFGVSGSAPDAYGTTAFNAQANFNVAAIGRMRDVAYTTNAADNYFTVQAGATREQRLYKDWTMLIRADGQWSDTPLFSNEQFGMGGTAGVRGYTDGEAYGDTGWRVAIEPRTPLINIGMVDGDVPFWVRASVFMDYGETYLLQKISATAKDSEQFWGFGTSLTANIGSHLDARLTLALPLLATAATPAWDFHFYFGVGAQF